ncbi:hypothetical protein DFH07DRAFT_325362 [Mycena maculata]|uniref:Uncharacterized protein n=1 Tax=Mycena maculata TaxID=230809 RepID=A0AAD7P0D5_9AGAR|nr:hypothetical protein DFH07DRAFT_325362 [Mycena maculata]
MSLGLDFVLFPSYPPAAAAAACCLISASHAASNCLDFFLLLGVVNSLRLFKYCITWIRCICKRLYSHRLVSSRHCCMFFILFYIISAEYWDEQGGPGSDCKALQAAKAPYKAPKAPYKVHQALVALARCSNFIRHF